MKHNKGKGYGVVYISLFSLAVMLLFNLGISHALPLFQGDVGVKGVEVPLINFPEALLIVGIASVVLFFVSNILGFVVDLHKF